VLVGVLRQVVDVARAEQLADLGVGGLLAEVGHQVDQLADRVDRVLGRPVGVDVLGVLQVLAQVPEEPDVAALPRQVQGPVPQDLELLRLEERAVVVEMRIGGHGGGC
jgi:hypothetical protein